MSLFNAFITADRALVGVDTECLLPNGDVCEVSKMIPLPHINAVLTFRGSTLILIKTAGTLIWLCTDFDILSEKLPEILKSKSDEAIASAHNYGITKEVAGCVEALLVGFSPRMGRITGHFFQRSSLSDGIVTSRDIDNCIAPDPMSYDPSFQTLDISPDIEGMKYLAMAQVRLMREHERGGSAGGRLILADIRRDGMTIESLCDFPKRMS